MIGWILGGLAAVVAGKALLDDDGNKKNESNNNIMWIQCPFCNGNMTITQSLERRHITCSKCHKKFIVDRRIPLYNMLVIQCVSCGRDVEVQTNSDEKATCKHCGTVFEYEKYKTVSCASCGKGIRVPAYKYAEVKCNNCGAIFNSDKGTLYRKTNSMSEKTSGDNVSIQQDNHKIDEIDAKHMKKNNESSDFINGIKADNFKTQSDDNGTWYEV